VDAARQGFCLRIKDSLNQELLWNLISRFGGYEFRFDSEHQLLFLSASSLSLMASWGSCEIPSRAARVRHPFICDEEIAAVVITSVQICRMSPLNYRSRMPDIGMIDKEDGVTPRIVAMKRKRLFLTALIVLLPIAAGVGAPPKMRTIAAGSWGGPHMNLTVTPEGFRLEFDCAGGSAKGAPAIDRNGRFKLYGTYVSQPGSPSVPREAHPAEYSGSVKGKLMTLDVKLTDSKQSIGIYKLVFGQLQRLNKCPVSRPQAHAPPLKVRANHSN
jgi:hypothetical protein